MQTFATVSSNLARLISFCDGSMTVISRAIYPLGSLKRGPWSTARSLMIFEMERVMLSFNTWTDDVNDATYLGSADSTPLRE